jgi:hypothetical protein
MRRGLNLMASALLAPAALGVFQCAAPTDPPAAGGSGAGNPGGTVALSMLASTEQALGKRGIAEGEGFVPHAGPRQIIANDHAGMELTITGISLTNVGIHFMLDTSESPQRLLSAMQQRPPELSMDTHSIVLSGPYLFNALAGNVDPSIRALRLPIARYIGVKLHFNRDSVSGEPLRSQIVMNGTFDDNGTTRNLLIDLTNSSWPWYQQSFRFAGGIFTLTPSDTTNLQLQFNSKIWFSQVDFARLLYAGNISVDDSTGTLTISNRSSRSPSRDIANAIFKDFISSGRLVVF